jgi:hypothetical protein
MKHHPWGGSLMANEKEYTGLVSAISAPHHIDNDGLDYIVINLIDTVPPAPEVPYVLYIDTSKPNAPQNARRVAKAFVTKRRVKIGLEILRKSRIEWVKRDH